MNLIDMDKTTADSAVIQAIVGMLSACHAKHSDACMAPNCAECLARYFNAKIYDHLHDIIADVAPVVHGRWKVVYNSVGKQEGQCTHCGKNSGILITKKSYCPHCGAKMDESEGKQ